DWKAAPPGSYRDQGRAALHRPRHSPGGRLHADLLRAEALTGLDFAGTSGVPLSPVERPPLELIFVEPLVQVQAFEQELHDRGLDLRPVGQLQTLHRHAQLRGIAESPNVR